MTSILQDRGLVRSMLAVLLVGILIITTLWILRPFFPAIIWATMVVVATWVGFSSIQTQELAERIAPCLREIILWFVKQIGYCSSGPLCRALDNFLKPVLIQRNANLSLVMVFVGVIGGLIAFGIIGIFIGPAVLAVSSPLLNVWMDEYGIEEMDHPAQGVEENTGNEIPAIKTISVERDDKEATSGAG
jgi:hypothetical protein